MPLAFLAREKKYFVAFRHMEDMKLQAMNGIFVNSIKSLT